MALDEETIKTFAAAGSACVSVLALTVSGMSYRAQRKLESRIEGRKGRIRAASVETSPPAASERAFVLNVYGGESPVEITGLNLQVDLRWPPKRHAVFSYDREVFWLSYEELVTAGLSGPELPKRLEPYGQASWTLARRNEGLEPDEDVTLTLEARAAAPWREARSYTTRSKPPLRIGTFHDPVFGLSGGATFRHGNITIEDARRFLHPRALGWLMRLLGEEKRVISRVARADAGDVDNSPA